MQNYKTLQQSLLGVLVMSRRERREREREEEEKKMPFGWPPTFMPAANGSEHTSLGPIT
jgi:hypothetical protein